LNLPPRKRSISQGARAIIQAETSMPTAKRRETERPTECGEVEARFCWKSEAKKGSEAAPAAGPMTLKGALKRSLALPMRVMPPLDGGEVVEEDAVEHDERDADHEGQGELEPLEEGGIAEADARGVAEAGAEGADGVEQRGAEDDSGEDADGERVDAEPRRCRKTAPG
jgi:hypothetical protein